jgi:hypothetical protein
MRGIIREIPTVGAVDGGVNKFSRYTRVNIPCYVEIQSSRISGSGFSNFKSPQQARGLTRKFYPWRSSCSGGLLMVPESPPLTGDLRGAIRAVSHCESCCTTRGSTFRRQATCYSVIASFVDESSGRTSSWFSQGDGSNSFPGVNSIKGKTIASPFVSVDTVSIGIPPSDDAAVFHF